MTSKDSPQPIKTEAAANCLRGAGRDERVAFGVAASLRRPGHRSYCVRVFDAAPAGCKIEFIDRPPIGERVWIKFDQMEALEGTIRWLQGHVGGVQFERPIHEAVFERLVARSKADPGST